MSGAIRLRRLIAEDEPIIQAYDQDVYAQRLHYDRPIAASLAALAAVRALTAELLDRLTEAEWQRTGTPLRGRRLQRLDVAGDVRRARP